MVYRTKTAWGYNVHRTLWLMSFFELLTTLMLRLCSPSYIGFLLIFVSSLKLPHQHLQFVILVHWFTQMMLTRNMYLDEHCNLWLIRSGLSYLRQNLWLACAVSVMLYWLFGTLISSRLEYCHYFPLFCRQLKTLFYRQAFS